jgi:chromosome segregation and condensation protein ScpB
VPDGESLPKRGAAELKAILEALIFASPDPMTPKAMCKLLDSEPKEDVLAALAELKQDYERPGGLELSRSPAAIRSSPAPTCTSGCAACFTSGRRRSSRCRRSRRSPVIAYRQPITAAEITEGAAASTRQAC